MTNKELNKIINAMPEHLEFNLSGTIKESAPPSKTVEEIRQEIDKLSEEINKWCDNEN